MSTHIILNGGHTLREKREPVIRTGKNLCLRILNPVLLLFVFLLGVNPASAQLLDEEETAFLEELKKLAWDNYEQNRIPEIRTRQAQLEIRQRRLEWFNALNVSYVYYPEFTSTVDPAQNENLSRFGLGFNINIGSLMRVPGRVRDARLDLEAARYTEDIQKKMIDAQVIDRYAVYKMNLELTQLHEEAVDNARSMLELVRQQFEMGEVPFEDLQRATEMVTQSRERLITARNDLLKAKGHLEELTGVPLEEVYQ